MKLSGPPHLPEVSYSTAFHSAMPLLNMPAAIHYLAPDDRVDCATAFSLHLLCKGKLAVHTYSAAFLRRCAVNFVHNFGRDRAYISRHEVAWPQFTDEEGATAAKEFDARLSDPSALLHQSETHTILGAAMSHLTRLQQDYLTLYFYENATYVEISIQCETTPDAVRMTVTRALQRLRKLLSAQGYAEEDMYGVPDGN